jgi:hypothetical protein
VNYLFDRIKKRKQPMNITPKHLLTLMMLMPLVVNSAPLKKAEKAILGVAGILSVYTAECGDLTSAGDKMFILIAEKFEKNGGILWEYPEYKKGVTLVRDSIAAEGLSKACKSFKDMFKKVPVWNKAIK